MMDYAEAWREHRKLWRRFLLCLVGGHTAIPLGLALFSMFDTSPQVAKRFENRWVPLASVTWLLSSAYSMWKVIYGFTCPACGKLFHHDGLSHSSSLERCMHCGLPVNAPPPLVLPEGASPMRLPLFIQAGDLRVFHSIRDAERALSRAKSQTAEALDCAGLHLRLRPWTQQSLLGWKSKRILLEPAEAQPTGRERLRELLGDCLRAHGTSRGWLERASFDEWVREAARVLKADGATHTR